MLALSLGFLPNPREHVIIINGQVQQPPAPVSPLYTAFKFTVGIAVGAGVLFLAAKTVAAVSASASASTASA